MPVHVALLRAVNVGGRNPVAMAELRELCGHLGLRNVRSLLQSGNLVFECDARRPASLAPLLETEAEKSLGLKTSFLVRSATEWKAVVAKNPFPGEAKRDPGHLLAVFLKDPPKPAAVRALRAAIVGAEKIEADGRQLYIYYPDGVGRSRLTLALIERVLGTLGTGRNWNTVLKLEALTRT